MKKLNVTSDIDMVVLSMVERGFRIDREEIHKLQRSLKSSVEVNKQLLERALLEWIPVLNLKDIKLNSTKFMGEIIYEYLGLPIIKRTPAGKPSLDQEVLEVLQERSNFVTLYRGWRRDSSQLSTVNNLIKDMDRNGYVHGRYNPEGTITGRFTCMKPNIQNVDRSLKYLFKAPAEKKYLTIDLKQAEYQLAFLLAGERPADDIHTELSQEVGIERKDAKVINLGILYGMSGSAIGKLLGKGKLEGTLFLKQWFKTYPKVARTISAVKDECELSGYSSTLGGRKAKRSPHQAFNFMVQGTLAELIKIGMCKVDAWFNDKQIDGGLVATIHDSIVLEVPEDFEGPRRIFVERLFSEVEGFNFNYTSTLSDRWE